MKPDKRMAALIPKACSVVTIVGSLTILISLTQSGYAQEPPSDAGTKFSSSQHQKALGALPVPPMTIEFRAYSNVKDKAFADARSDDVGHDILTSELLEILDRLTRHYIDNNHVRSKAIRSNQDGDHGRIVVRVVEDRSSETIVGGRVSHEVDSVFNVSQLQDRIEFLLPDPTIGRLNTWLNLSFRPEVILPALDAGNSTPHIWDVIFANHHSPPLSLKRGAAQLRHAGVTGRNGLVPFGFSLSEYMKNDASGYDKLLDATDVHLVAFSNDWAFKGLEKPFTGTTKRELRPAAFVKRQRTETPLRVGSFSSAVGIGSSKSEISVLRLKQNERRLAREQTPVLQGVWSRNSNLLGTKQNAGNFADTQPTLDPSLPIERVGIGGSDTEEKALVFDNGWISATALQISIGRVTVPGVAENSDGGFISLSPFIDTGDDGLNDQTLAIEGGAGGLFSVGAGLGWQITNQTDLRLGVDIPLGDASSPQSDDSQDLGFQFRLATELNN